MSCCCCLYDFIKYRLKSSVIPTIESFFTTQLFDIVQKISVSDIRKKIIHDRYILRVKQYKDQYNYNNRWNDLLKIIITIGSLAIPTMISLQQYNRDCVNSPEKSCENTNDLNSLLFWISMATSFLISISSAIRELYQLDKKVIYQLETKEALVAELWKYIELSGKYTRYSNHEDAFIYFCNKMEKILYYSNQKKILLSLKKQDDEESGHSLHQLNPIYNIESSPKTDNLNNTITIKPY